MSDVGVGPSGLERHPEDRRKCQEQFDAYRACRKTEVRPLLFPEDDLTDGIGLADSDAI